MAEFVNSFGKIRGKFGNVISYVGANGKNYCKGASLSRKSGTEAQKRQAAAFGAVVKGKIWMKRVIRLGFPGNIYPKGFNGFTSVNVMTAVTVEKIDSTKPVDRHKKTVQEFRGTIDYANSGWQRAHLCLRLLLVKLMRKIGKYISHTRR